MYQFGALRAPDAEFHIHSPKIGENGLHPPPKKKKKKQEQDVQQEREGASSNYVKVFFN